MADTIFTSLSPNVESDDLNLTLGYLVRPFEWVIGSSISRFEKNLKDYLGVEHIFSFESGRSALYFLLSNLGLKSGDEVLVQAYTCVAVPDPVLWVGATPVYVDIEKDTLNMSPTDLEKKITERSRVLIIQHTFGNPASLEKLIAIAKKHHLLVIEDCAHTLGAKYKGKMVGLFGDASFFSFGRDKVISSVFGGMLVVNNKNLLGNLTNSYQHVPFPSEWWVLQQLLHPPITHLTKVFYSFLSLGKVLIDVAIVLKLISKAVYPVEKQGGKPKFVLKRLPNALADLADHQLDKLERFNAHRKKVANEYREAFKDLDVVHQQSYPGAENIYLRYTLLTPDSQDLITEAKSKDLVLGDWYSQPISPTGVNYEKIKYNPSTTPVASQISPMSVNLPTHTNIGDLEVKRVVDFVRGYYARDKTD